MGGSGVRRIGRSFGTWKIVSPGVLLQGVRAEREARFEDGGTVSLPGLISSGGVTSRCELSGTSNVRTSPGCRYVSED